MDLIKLQEDYIKLVEYAYQVKNTPTIDASKVDIQTTLISLVDMYCAHVQANPTTTTIMSELIQSETLQAEGIQTLQQRRKVQVTLVDYWAKKYELPLDQNPFEGYLLGIFQSQDGDSAEPIAVIELEGGQVADVAVDKMKFFDWEDD